MKGVEPFKAEGAMDDIRRLLLQSEVFTILARKDAKVAGFDDLKGKRVNIGNPGSGQRDTFEEIMAVKGWDKSAFSLVSELKPAEQASALGDNNIDAMSYFVGHPNGAIQEASTTTDTVLVPVTGPEIDKLLAEKSYYSKAEIPGGLYKGSPNPTPSIGGKAVLSTSAKADPEVVYQLVKSVFDNLDRFKRLHPAFADLKEADMIKVGLSARCMKARSATTRNVAGCNPAAASDVPRTAPPRGRESRYCSTNRVTLMQQTQQQEALSAEELIAQDVGARLPVGAMSWIIAGLALVWSLFQLWIASPLPFSLGVGVLNDTETRSIHLAFAILLAYLVFPALRTSPRDPGALADIASASSAPPSPATCSSCMTSGPSAPVT